MEQQDYYKILKVEASESQQKIKESYRKLALKYHPDHNRDDAAAAARMKAINESYAVLSDPQKRSRYDALRKTYGDAAHDRFKQTYSEQDIFREAIFSRFLRNSAVLSGSGVLTKSSRIPTGPDTALLNSGDPTLLAGFLWGGRARARAKGEAARVPDFHWADTWVV